MNAKGLVTAIAVIAIAACAYCYLTMPDQRTGTQKVGDAVHDLGDGPTAAARQLESRTPGQKVGDAIKDNTSANQ